MDRVLHALPAIMCVGYSMFFVAYALLCKEVERQALEKKIEWNIAEREPWLLKKMTQEEFHDWVYDFGDDEIDLDDVDFRPKRITT